MHGAGEVSALQRRRRERETERENHPSPTCAHHGSLRSLPGPLPRSAEAWPPRPSVWPGARDGGQRRSPRSDYVEIPGRPRGNYATSRGHLARLGYDPACGLRNGGVPRGPCSLKGSDSMVRLEGFTAPYSLGLGLVLFAGGFGERARIRACERKRRRRPAGLAARRTVACGAHERRAVALDVLHGRHHARRRARRIAARRRDRPERLAAAFSRSRSCRSVRT